MDELNILTAKRDEIQHLDGKILALLEERIAAAKVASAGQKPCQCLSRKRFGAG